MRFVDTLGRILGSMRKNMQFISFIAFQISNVFGTFQNGLKLSSASSTCQSETEDSENSARNLIITILLPLSSIKWL